MWSELLVLAKNVAGNSKVRVAFKWAKTIGLTGLLLSGAQQAAVALAPQSFDAFYNPVAEAVGLHRPYAAISHEPAEAPLKQGDVGKTDNFYYEFKLTDLNSVGSVYGRFHGVAATPDGPVDPRWWTVRGTTNGNVAQLHYVNEKGVPLGNIVLRRSADTATWAGHLTGIDQSISDKDFVQSPIIVTQSRYELPRVAKDSFLATAPRIVAGYDRSAPGNSHQ